MLTRSTIVAALAFVGAVSALPANNVRCEEDEAHGSMPADNADNAKCTPGRIVAPMVITLNDANPNDIIRTWSGDELSLSLGEKGKNQDNIALFRGIPSDAKTCTFGWKQRANNTEESFKTDGNAFVEYRMLPKAEGPWSYNDVKKLAEKDDKPGHIDLTFWDESDTSRSHSGGSISCAEDMYILLTVSDMTAKTGGVKLEGVPEGEEEALQGVSLSWEC